MVEGGLAAPETKYEGPDMMELVDQLENFEGEDVEELNQILRNVGKCCEADPTERDMFGDCDGFDHLKPLLLKLPGCHGAWCEMIPALVSKHVINQCSIRDDDESATVHFRKTGPDSFDAIKETDQEAPVHVPMVKILFEYVKEKVNALHDKPPTCAIPFDALRAVTVQNDANKRAITTLGGLDLLLRAASSCLPKDPEAEQASAKVLTSVIMAFGSLCKDDDPRQPSCVPTAVENRDGVGKSDFPELRRICRRAIELYGEHEHVGQKCCDVVFPLLKDTSNHHLKIGDLVRKDKMLQTAVYLCKFWNERGGEVGVKSTLAFIRHIAMVDVPKGTTISRDMVGEDMKEYLANDCEFLKIFFRILKVNMNGSERVTEQCFGLLSNMVLRKEHIALNFVHQYELIDNCRLALFKFGTKSPIIIKTVLQVLLNIGQIEECCKLMEDDVIYAKAREVFEHAEAEFKGSGNEKWRDAYDKCKRFLTAQREEVGAEVLGKHR